MGHRKGNAAARRHRRAGGGTYQRGEPMSKTRAIASILCLLSSLQGYAADAAKSWLIKDVTLISPERAAPLPHADVLIEDGSIARVGADLTAPNAAHIDGRGRFLIPGLIDSHVHVDHLVGLDDEIIAADPQLLKDYHTQLPRSYLAFGFTSLVDLDFEPGMRGWYEAQPLRPRLYHCGPGIRIAAGYGTRKVTKDAKLTKIPNLVYEPAQAENWPAMLDPRDYTPEKAVGRAVAIGATCAKVFVESGFGGTFNWPIPRPETNRLGFLRRGGAARPVERPWASSRASIDLALITRVM
jgi:hypothetical protein